MLTVDAIYNLIDELKMNLTRIWILDFLSFTTAFSGKEILSKMHW